MFDLKSQRGKEFLDLYAKLEKDSVAEKLCFSKSAR